VAREVRGQRRQQAVLEVHLTARHKHKQRNERKRSKKVTSMWSNRSFVQTANLAVSAFGCEEVGPS
jgi:hypothetical protein